MLKVLAFDRQPWPRALLLVVAMPLFGLAVVHLPVLDQFPGLPFIAMGVLVAYLAGIGIGLIGLAGALVTAHNAGLHPPARYTTAAYIVTTAIAVGLGLIMSIVNDDAREGRALAEESEQRWRSLLEAAFEAVVLTAGGYYLEVNAGFERLVGRSRDEIVGRRVIDFIHPADHDLPFAAASEPYHAAEIRLVRPDGEVRLVRAFRRNVVFQGRPARLSALEDITDTRRNDREREAVDARFRALFDSRAVGVTVATIEGVYLEANQVFLDLVKRSRDEVVGHNFRDFTSDSQPGILERIEAGDDGPFVFDSVLNDRDGLRVSVHVNLALVRDEAGAPLYTVGVLTSSEEERRLEAQLRQTQKMEAVGKLAGGVAHDFNNLLTVIGANLMLLQESGLRADQVGYTDEIADAARRAGAMTRQLLSFARRRESSLRPLDVNGVVRGIVPLVRTLLAPAGVDLDVRLASSPLFVAADATQLEQIVLNLAANARDATTGGGLVTIETLAAGEHVCLRVSDTGEGIDPEVIEQIFDPFFTTKGPGEGTGLGLSTVYGFVTAFGGEIDVESELGKGTTFVVTLPQALERPEVVGDARAAPARSARTGAKLLLVDDEPGVRLVAEKALSRAGHSLLSAGNPFEALALIADDEQEIDMLITDLAMPGMNGLELADAVRERFPDLPVLYVSGYSDEILRTRPSTDKLDVLEKPFSPQTLVARVSEALENAG